jgi:hypothetical protein
MHEAKMSADRDAKFEILEKAAIIQTIISSVIEFETKLITDLDVD